MTTEGVQRSRSGKGSPIACRVGVAVPLARKITRAKWQAEGLGAAEIPADALGDMRTFNNDLSWWRTDEAGLSNVALALGAAAEKAAKIELVWIEEQALAEAGLVLVNTLGDTPVAELQGMHGDVQRLDTSRLLTLTAIVSGALTANRHKIFTLEDVRKLIVDAVLAGKVQEEQLSQKLRGELQARIAAARQQQQP